MRLFILLSVLLSTLPVMALNLTPRSGEDVLGIFEGEYSAADLVSNARRQGLIVVSFDKRFGHLIVKNQNGEASQALQKLGASYVLDAGFAAFCQSGPDSPRSTT